MCGVVKPLRVARDTWSEACTTSSTWPTPRVSVRELSPLFRIDAIVARHVRALADQWPA